MIYLPSLPSGFTIFCDDIRQEVSGKITLVGAYADEMTVFGEAPLVLPQLKALIVCRFPPANPPRLVTLKVLYTRKDAEDITLLESEIPCIYDEEKAGSAASIEEMAANPDTFTFGELRTLASLSGISLLGPGFIRTRFLVGDDEIRLGALEIKLRPDPVSPQVVGN